MFVPHGVVLEESRAVAEELGLPSWWLNEQASVYVSGKDDPGKRRVFDHPHLRIMVASPEHIFAMKAMAAPATSTTFEASPRSLTFRLLTMRCASAETFIPTRRSHRGSAAFSKSCLNSGAGDHLGTTRRSRRAPPRACPTRPSTGTHVPSCVASNLNVLGVKGSWVQIPPSRRRSEPVSRRRTGSL